MQRFATTRCIAASSSDCALHVHAALTAAPAAAPAPHAVPPPEAPPRTQVMGSEAAVAAGLAAAQRALALAQQPKAARGAKAPRAT